jgi:putative integral membrane protein (TIGR02587 family)
LAQRSASPGEYVAITNRQYAVALGRAFAGAIIFSLPLLLTMEMWWFGYTVDSRRLFLFLVANMVMLVGLSRVAGFEESHNWVDDVLDTFAAVAVAAFTAAVILWLIGEIEPDMPLREIAGKIAVQSVPASFGAMIGAKLLGEGDEIEQQEHWRRTYPGQLFLMLAGALFVSFTVAPTEEVILIAYQMGPTHALLLALLSMLLLYAMMHLVGFRGQQARREKSASVALIRYTLPGYGIAVAASLFILWTFGRTDGANVTNIAMSAVVLAFPGSLGAAIARIVV